MHIINTSKAFFENLYMGIGLFKWWKKTNYSLAAHVGPSAMGTLELQLIAMHIPPNNYFLMVTQARIWQHINSKAHDEQ